MRRDELDDVRALLPGLDVERGEDLGGSDRSAVHRLRARAPGSSDTTLVVKRFLAAGEGWVREAAALATVGDTAPTAVVIAEVASPPLLVTNDLGKGPNVADALLGDSAERAAQAVQAWAEAVARLHRATLGGRERFRTEIERRAGDVPVPVTALPAYMDESVALLQAQCTGLGVDPPAGALAQLRELPRRLTNNGDASALSPADACPDNNVQGQDGLRLLDFEGAEWRHVAWDVAYLTVPWPTCRCSWRMPREVSERALERYRATIEDVLPYVREQQFRRDVAAAAAGWAMLSTAQFLPLALADDPPPRDPVRIAPTPRAMILHRLDGARRNQDLTALAELAQRLRVALVARWGEVPLGLAAAFDPDHH